MNPPGRRRHTAFVPPSCRGRIRLSLACPIGLQQPPDRHPYRPIPKGGFSVPDLQDDESVEMKGSGSKPYVLRNVGGVYSCSCPAWRNQSVAIEKRTCKHLRKLRGDAAEEARVGSAVPALARAKAGDDEKKA